MTRFIYILLFFFLHQYFYAQIEHSEVREDFGVWSKLELEKSLSKKWSAGLNSQYRLKENATQLRTFIVELDTERDLKNKFSTGVKWRYSWEGEKQVARVSPYIKKTIRIKPFNVRYRSQWDAAYRWNNDPWRMRWRNKFGIEYQRKKNKLSPGMYVEYFHNTDELWYAANDIRFKMEMAFKLNKKWNLKLGYLVQQELNTREPVRDYVLYSRFKYSLD